MSKNSQIYFLQEEVKRLKEQLAIHHGLRTETQTLRNAFDNKELFLEYQPIVDVMTDSCIGVEALVRWQHPKLGLILPLDFLPQMEELGMIEQLNQWVIQQACSDYAQLKQSNLSLSINISTTSLDITNIKEAVLKTLQLHHIKADQLILELTEMTPSKIFTAICNEFSASGIQIAIDDYGEGYTSLSYLKLPITILKIDKSFIANIEQDLKDKLIIESTIELAHRLGLKVTAEGVETQEQHQVLKTHGCDYAQGFYFSKSLSLEDLKTYLSEKRGT